MGKRSRKLIVLVAAFSLLAAGCATGSIKLVGKVAGMDCYEYSEQNAFLSLGFYGCQDPLTGKLPIQAKGVGPGPGNGFVAPLIKAGGSVAAGAVGPPGGGH